MAESLTPPERETVILFSDADDTATITTWQRTIIELYPNVVDGPEEEGGVPSRLIKTDAGGRHRREGTPWQMLAGSPSGRTLRSRSRSTSSLGRALGA
jgi:hypothetical protein